jgi:RimJ/RimL family protein N-acetyltransferase
VDDIITERLLLRPFRAEDLPAFVAYRGAPEVARLRGPAAGMEGMRH